MVNQFDLLDKDTWSTLYFYLLSVMLVILVARSGQFFLRTVREFQHPQPPFHPEITECSTYLESTQGQLRGIYNYRSLGKPCEAN